MCFTALEDLHTLEVSLEMASDLSGNGRVVKCVKVSSFVSDVLNQTQSLVVSQGK